MYVEPALLRLPHRPGEAVYMFSSVTVGLKFVEEFIISYWMPKTVVIWKRSKMIYVEASGTVL